MMEEAKAELADLQDSDGEELYGGINQNAKKPEEAEQQSQEEKQIDTSAVGDKRPRNQEMNEKLNQLDRR